jgi:hypothetical protein
MPKNSGAGIVIAAFATVFGFAMIWHIWWMAIASFIGIVRPGLLRALTRTWITTYRLQKSKNWKISISMRLTKQG